jgi:glutamate/tyrosine decarboxylase-like PLP-dependent enzyme
MGGFDKFEEIAAVCKRYAIWFHIDACWGGHAFFSPKFAGLVHGAALSDSIVIDPHKGLGVPIQMSMLLTNNHRGELEKSNCMNIFNIHSKY